MATEMRTDLPPPPPDVVENDTVWIGNISFTVTEYILLQLLKRYGTLQKFDLPHHKEGPCKGQHRGFCFVSYQNRQDAERAMRCLHNQSVMGKRLSACWANSQTQHGGIPKKYDATKRKEHTDPTLVLSNETKIRMIERKLQHMNSAELHPESNLTVDTPCTKRARVDSTNRQPSRVKTRQTAKHSSRDIVRQTTEQSSCEMMRKTVEQSSPSDIT